MIVASSPLRITRLSPSDYRRTPWKNGGGVTIDIAGAWRAGSQGDWSGMLWRFGRTAIVEPAPFSDLSGYDRVQIAVRGRGLSLQTPNGEIDVREPFKPARFAGETPITSRLDHGPVEVVNLIGARADAAIDLRALRADESAMLSSGLHIVYAADGDADVICGETAFALEADHALRIDDGAPTIACASGVIVVASIHARA